MPTVGLEVGGLDLAKCHEEHDEEQHGLEHLDHREYIMLDLVGKGQLATNIVCQGSAYHGYGECPVLQKTD